MTGHNHIGDATYIAYAQGCRDGDCLRAFEDYKLRLAKRKLAGEFLDLRRKEHRLAAETRRLSDLRPEPGRTEAETPAAELPALPAGASDPSRSAPGTGDSDPAEQPEISSADAKAALLKVLNILADFSTRVVSMRFYDARTLAHMADLPEGSTDELVSSLTTSGYVEQLPDGDLRITSTGPGGA